MLFRRHPYCFRKRIFFSRGYDIWHIPEAAWWVFLRQCRYRGCIHACQLLPVIRGNTSDYLTDVPEDLATCEVVLLDTTLQNTVASCIYRSITSYFLRRRVFYHRQKWSHENCKCWAVESNSSSLTKSSVSTPSATRSFDNSRWNISHIIDLIPSITTGFSRKILKPISFRIQSDWSKCLHASERRRWTAKYEDFEGCSEMNQMRVSQRPLTEPTPWLVASPLVADLWIYAAKLKICRAVGDQNIRYPSLVCLLVCAWE